MKKAITGIIFVIFAVTALLVGYSYQVSSPLFDEVLEETTPRIAGMDKALTFARTRDALLLVTAHHEQSVTGRNLTAVLGSEATADLLLLYRRLGYYGIGTIEAPQVEAPLETLLPPLDFAHPGIAAGTNFKEHADEVYLDDPPFLFPKLVSSTAWDADIPFTPRLDYEAELCMFPLDDIDGPGSKTAYGLILCNDMTDRMTLVSEIDLSGPLGETGFAAGKGCPGCLPTGYLAVIPESADLHRQLEVRLYLNGELRQRFHMDQMILSIDEIVQQAFDQAGVEYAFGNETRQLLPSGGIPAGTLILTGTAAGILFKPVNIWNQGFYLQPGDIVRTEADYLGYLLNEVAE